MGTRGEIYVRGSNSVIELWRHYDTYRKYMEPYFRLFARYAAWAVGSQRHWLTYPEDVAAMLIAFDYEVTLASRLPTSSLDLFECRPDLRPRGNIEDFEKVWILDVEDVDEAGNIVWRVRGFDYKYGTDASKMRNAIRLRKDSKLDLYLVKTSDFKVKPVNDGDRCKGCGYPGPLLLEDPPLCIYCLVKRIKNDNFVKEQVEQILKIAPLISS